MHAHKIKLTIPSDHQLTFKVPDDFPPGPAEVIIMADASPGKRLVKLEGVLASDMEPADGVDPIADALHEIRQERKRRFNKLETIVKDSEDA